MLMQAIIDNRSKSEYVSTPIHGLPKRDGLDFTLS